MRKEKTKTAYFKKNICNVKDKFKSNPLLFETVVIKSVHISDLYIGALFVL